MQALLIFDNGVKYLLTVIDVLSRYGWMVRYDTIGQFNVDSKAEYTA